MLDKKVRQDLKRQAHSKDPVVTIGGNGLTDGVLAETARALHDHELIKLRVNASDRVARRTMIAELASQLGAEIIQEIGHVAVIYRRADEIIASPWAKGQKPE